MKKLVISTDFILLKNALKLLGFIETGGEAKFFLSSNDVYINDIKEDKRGRKLVEGDVLKALNQEVIISHEN